MKTPPPARLHLLPAKSASYTVVLRRKPTDWFHVLRWNTETDEIENGAWFHGTLYPTRADLSFDGRFLVFLALEKGIACLNRISHAPLLTQIHEAEANGTYRGGGYWESPTHLRLNGWTIEARDGRKKVEETLSATLETYEDELGETGVLYQRLRRDGWSRAGDNWGNTSQSGNHICTGDDGWTNQPSAAHPTLRMVNTGYKNSSLQFKFWLEEFPKLIPEQADWACWDALGQLLFSCAGSLYKYALDDIRAGTARTVINLEHLSPPASLE
ncbi:hypothetical protein [Undibacterium sp.]|uniref:hypothetical protein n=1 Tax=Undibacterium sp. TaxID=1914977 RepID=UPI0027304AF3|nr:hypothetical protein [Undibacterium sp.]MDP1977367.1 hypothetical protein [Undibacterium sp.]